MESGSSQVRYQGQSCPCYDLAVDVGLHVLCAYTIRPAAPRVGILADTLVDTLEEIPIDILDGIPEDIPEYARSDVPSD
jgi:hypothetical protein